MRRIVMFNRVTADGCFATADGSLDWVVPEPDLDRAAADSSGGFDTVLFGRRTFDMFESFWPKVIDQGGRDAPDPHGAGRRSPEMRAIADMLDAAQKLVFSRTRTQSKWRNTRFFAELDAAALAAMKQQPGKDMMLFGSGSIVTQLTQHDLIDEYQFVLSPLLLGGGKRLFDGLPERASLRLLQAQGYPAGNVMVRYERSR